jgi:dihydrofolate synthase/folylpolyglutamate synthase
MQRPEAAAVIARRAREVGSPLWMPMEVEVEPPTGLRDPRAYRTSGVVVSAGGSSFDYSLPALDVEWSSLRLPLVGRHQVENAATAVTAALRVWAHGRVLLSEATVRLGLAKVQVAARLERVAADVIVDGAHQPAGARALRQALDTVYAGRPVFLVLGVLSDKDREGISAALVGRASATWVTVPPWSERAGDREALEAWAGAVGGTARADWRDALSEARVAASRVRGALVVVSGSLYLVGEVRELLRRAARGQ